VPPRAQVLLSLLNLASDFIVMRSGDFHREAAGGSPHARKRLAQWLTAKKVVFYFKKVFLEFWGGAAETFDEPENEHASPVIGMNGVRMGWSFLVAIVLSLYQANITVGLIQKQAVEATTITGLKACMLTPGCDLCIHGATSSRADTLLADIAQGSDHVLDEYRRRVHVVAQHSAELAIKMREQLYNPTVPTYPTTYDFVRLPKPTSGHKSAAYESALAGARRTCAHIGATMDTSGSGYTCTRPAAQASCGAYI